MCVRRDSPNLRVYLSISPGKLISATVPGDATPPALRYNDGVHKWQASNDGIAFFNLGGGGGYSGSFVKVVDTLLAPLPAESIYLIPNGQSYTMSAGNHLDVFFNGQLLNHDHGSDIRDYIEMTTTTIKFHFDVDKMSTLTFIIK